MRKFLLALFIIASMVADSQPPNYVPVPVRYNWLGGYFRALHVPAGTTPALTTGQWPGSGALFMDTSGTDTGLYMYILGDWVRLADTTDLTTEITNIGSSYRLWDPVTPGLKTLAAGTGITIDSSTANTITITGVQRFGVSGEDDEFTLNRYVNMKARTLTLDSADGVLISNWDGGGFTAISSLSVPYSIIQADNFIAKVARYESGSDAEFTSTSGSGVAYNDINMAKGSTVSRLQAWGDSARYTIKYNVSSPTKYIYKISNASFDFRTDSLFATGLTAISDTTGYNVVVRDRTTGEVRHIPSTSLGGGGGSQNLQQVLDAGSTLTSSETIEVGANILSIYSSSTSSTVLDVYNANTGTGAFGITSYTEGGMAIAGGTNGANTNTPIRVGEFEASSTGTTAAGFGGFIGLALEHSTGAVVDAGSFGWNWTNPALASKTTNFTIKGFDSGVEETFMKIEPVYTIVNNGADTLSTMAYARSVGGGGGSGTVNSGTQYRLTYYATTGTAVSETNITSKQTAAAGNIFFNGGNTTATGTHNVGIGTNALQVTTTGGDNVSIGVNSGAAITTGSSNMLFGNQAGKAITSGGSNVAIGAVSLGAITTTSSNIGIGAFAGQTNTGSNNVFIGYASGSANISGSNNVFLGYTAGQNETGSNKLYIANSNTATPLIKGDFSASTLTINGTTTFENHLLLKDITEPSTPSAGYGALFVNSDKLKFKSDGGTVYTLENMGAGTYTPTNTNIGNIDAVTIYDLQYMIIGTIVHVSGAIGIDATSSGTVAQVDLSLPIASNFSSTTQANGVVVEDVATTTVGSGTIASDATNDRIQIRIMPSGTGALAYRFYFTYQVL